MPTESTNKSDVHGNKNIVIQDVSDSNITVNVNGETREVRKSLDEVKALLASQAAYLEFLGNRYYTEELTERSFAFLMARSKATHKLPEYLRDNPTDRVNWLESLREDLQQQGVPVGHSKSAILECYDWLIAAFLQKMLSAVGKEQTVRSFSFMAEAFQSTLRYMVYVQVAQLLHKPSTQKSPALHDFLSLSPEGQPRFDYFNLLQLTTTLIDEEEAFMPEIYGLLEELEDDEDLTEALFFLTHHRSRLLAGELAADDTEELKALLEDYLTALTYWLRRIAFIAKYHLVSIKDIKLNYRLGTDKSFLHLYGELHGTYSEGQAGFDYSSLNIKDHFTFNQSILLLRGNVANAFLNEEDYLSLSPLLIDQSVFSERPTQTPEIYYFGGKEKKNTYTFLGYKNELEYPSLNAPTGNKSLSVKSQNNKQPKLNELYRQLKKLI